MWIQDKWGPIFPEDLVNSVPEVFQNLSLTDAVPFSVKHTYDGIVADLVDHGFSFVRSQVHFQPLASAATDFFGSPLGLICWDWCLIFPDVKAQYCCNGRKIGYQRQQEREFVQVGALLRAFLQYQLQHDESAAFEHILDGNCAHREFFTCLSKAFHEANAIAIQSLNEIYAQFPTHLDEESVLTSSVIRCIHYPPAAVAAEGDFLASAGRRIVHYEHADVGLITVSPSATTSGLQIFSPSLKEWVDVDGKGTVVMAGEMLGYPRLVVDNVVRWLTGGLIRPALHRVVRSDIFPLRLISKGL